ncbi:hypothetical protein EMIHUDRAFT_229152 [Emiliania huxleyi CCMP1516]|uniref:Protein kinase domain-containing protein n=2 Tax=Emiliania huxleyi TaxID=2903 RepID=A0A0D3KDL8_EMIH1|nr:hypothetical protein EMIHUDRAFT_229152 [Emiliania huxleyi CCMP1516]EOD33853.1 hypothetical protein EMIHUDRAFT_229152 [Emiliania huxleyi CCMP1516]|eukprot:XP_005786282.1 hypothetical protein EMIHUDRAFT_229152 [Emiliania huxleyi CCMP1516]
MPIVRAGPNTSTWQCPPAPALHPCESRRWELSQLRNPEALSLDASWAPVRLGKWTGTGELCAVKEFDLSATARADMMHEAQLMEQCSHPHIVRILDVREDGLRLRLVLELCEGPTLQRLLDLRGALLEAEARRIFSQVCSALCYLRENLIVHRDVKPANVVLLHAVPDHRRSPLAGCVSKLIDFGSVHGHETWAALDMDGSLDFDGRTHAASWQNTTYLPSSPVRQRDWALQSASVAEERTIAVTPVGTRHWRATDPPCGALPSRPLFIVPVVSH